ncbi:hypothetical protein M0R04_12065 [Candidatus Dojkabacteria bacterium]|jgi:hypothetical protein|nr:hypothetical protein [Candidatus Dojkabacteria bacterium]
MSQDNYNAGAYWEARKNEVFAKLCNENKDWANYDTGDIYEHAQEIVEAEIEKNKDYAND